MRGVDPFSKLWRRRSSILLQDGSACEVMSLPDLVTAKKTQRDKDWPMIRRLVEVHYFENRDHPTRPQTLFWFRELRTPELLIELATRQKEATRTLLRKRPLLKFARPGQERALSEALLEEELREREKDRRYWIPLRAELEELRYARIL
jgi:hypothetical protein